MLVRMLLAVLVACAPPPALAQSPALTPAQIETYRTGEAVGRAFMIALNPGRCAIVLLRAACRSDVDAAQALGLVSPSSRAREERYLQTGDQSAFDRGALDMQIDALAHGPDTERGFLTQLGASKVIVQMTMGLSDIEPLARGMVTSVLQNEPSSLALVPRDALPGELVIDLNRLYPDDGSLPVQLGRDDESKYVRLGIYENTFDQMMDEPLLVLDSGTKAFARAFLENAMGVLGTDDKAAARTLLDSIESARTVHDIREIQLQRSKLQVALSGAVPQNRLAAFNFGIAVAQGAFNAAVEKNTERSQLWLKLATAYHGLDPRSPTLAHARNALESVATTDWPRQQQFFSQLVDEAMRVTQPNGAG